MAFHVPSKFAYGQYGVGNNGHFLIPHPNTPFVHFFCVASDGMGWEHVSVTLRKKKGLTWYPENRTPTWNEMCIVKDIFWDAEDAVMQLHPPRSEYVSTHPYCLHLWRPTNAIIPLPASILVGIPGDNKQSF